ncbi:MAG: protein translocase subunit SecF [Candidatus Manganitrophus sp.]|nr:protein translocase subunit SecF [Candidatus Manganitrophus sp.]WDT71222.1 MAG: protein translocase subunit SecF [Candidatus Manganitrophus sp.]WDT81476.1 MAG: protein translocase subunit SecF [Candidatus Manganitrophus sp.]
MFQVFKNTNIDFIGKRYLFFAVSGVLVALGLLALVRISQGKANLGIDFAGGAAIQLRFEQPIQIEEARAALEEGGVKGAELQEVVAENKLLVRLKQDIVQKNVVEQVQEALNKKFSGNQFTVESSTEIGPTIGEKLRKDALLAVTISIIGIIIYIAFRFEFRFGIAATLATFHDVLVVLGILFLLNKEITLLIVTALLTIAGYSLSDTVVVFDRIRENLRLQKRESFQQIVNRSINEVLSRTFITGVTTFLVLLAIFFFGGEVIRDFALAMLFGLIVGTYSSWFIASPLLLLWEKRAKVLKRASTQS